MNGIESWSHLEKPDETQELEYWASGQIGYYIGRDAPLDQGFSPVCPLAAPASPTPLPPTELPIVPNTWPGVPENAEQNSGLEPKRQEPEHLAVYFWRLSLDSVSF